MEKKRKKNQEHIWQENLDASGEQSGHSGPSHAHQDQCSTVPDIISESDILLPTPGNKNQPNDINEDDLA